MNEEKEKKIYITPINQWSQLFGKFNWYNWDVVNIGIEWDMEVTGGYEVVFIIMGLGFIFRHNVNFEDSKVGESFDEFMLSRKKDD